MEPTKIPTEYPTLLDNISNDKPYTLDSLNEVIAKQPFPCTLIDLPSEGLLYPTSNPLSLGKIVMKYRTAKEEDILTSEDLIAQGIMFDVYFKNMIVSKMNYDDLILGDKDAVMINAKILGDGKEYPLRKMVCPKCNHVHEKDALGTSQPYCVDLTTLKYKQPDKSLYNRDNIFEVVLPYSKKTVYFKLLTVGDDKAVDAEIEKLSKLTKLSGGVSKEFTTRLRKMIVKIDDISDPTKLYSIIENTTSYDLKELKKKINEVTPGVNTSFTFVCHKCKHEVEDVKLRIDSNFFWPNSI